MNRKILILGPPCVGKTTLISYALKAKIPVFSSHTCRLVFFALESEGHVSDRVCRESFFDLLVNLNIPFFYDAGGLNIDYINTYKNRELGIRTVLLLPPKDVYLKREGEEIKRDATRAQNGLVSFLDWDKSKSKVDLVIGEVLSAPEILKLIIKTFKFKNE